MAHRPTACARSCIAWSFFDETAATTKRTRLRGRARRGRGWRRGPRLAPTLETGDVVILDNLAAHKSAKAEAILRKCGAWFLFLPPDSPTSTPSKWPSPSSRRISDASVPEPSTPPGAPSAISATSTAQTNVETTSPPQATRPTKCTMLEDLAVPANRPGGRPRAHAVVRQKSRA